jgi:RHS repeat-associated protein
LTGLTIASTDGQLSFDHIGRTAPAPAHLTSFSSNVTSPSAPGVAITWTATATGTIPPLEYRFEREDAGTWSTVRAWDTANTWSWTPAAADAGDHSIRVSVRNAGSISDFEDQQTLTFTVSSGSGLLEQPRTSVLARLLGRFAGASSTPLALSFSSRVATEAAGDAIRYSLYTPELNLLSETEVSASASPAVAYDYIWFGGKPVAQVDVATNTTHWTFTDHLGTPILQTNAAGAIDWRAEYEPFGTVYALRTGDSRHQPLRFPGQEADAADGERSYNIFRWYRSGWGRYTQADPMGVNGGLNLYIYCSNDPLNASDSWGLQMDSVSRSLQEAIARGEVDEIGEILEEAGEELPPKLRETAQKALQRFRSKAKDLISKECKGSITKSFRSRCVRRHSLKSTKTREAAIDSLARRRSY